MEDDRHLAHGEAAPQRALRQLDLEAVAVRAHGVEVDRLEHLAAEALEAAGEVVDVEAEHAARVVAAAAADEPPQQPPVLDAAAVDVARSERDVGAVLHRREQARQVGRVVREVGVHLEDVARAGRERAAEAGEVGGAEALAHAAVEDLDVVVLGRQAVGDAPVPSGEESSTIRIR